MRHGRTAWNATGRFQGQSDIPLSPEGELQAVAIAQALADESLDAIVSSDLVRAFATATAVASPHGMVVNRDPRLREFAFGAWEGQTWVEILATYPEMAGVALTSVRAYTPPGGERFADVVARTGAVLDDYRERGERIVFVTHAGALHALLDQLVGDSVDLSKVILTPASITRIAMDGKRPRLEALNETAHLG